MLGASNWHISDRQGLSCHSLDQRLPRARVSFGKSRIFNRPSDKSSDWNSDSFTRFEAAQSFKRHSIDDCFGECFALIGFSSSRLRGFFLLADHLSFRSRSGDHRIRYRLGCGNQRAWVLI
jgi:hypothetical protein